MGRRSRSWCLVLRGLGLAMVAVADRFAPAEEQVLLQLHQHLDSTEARFKPSRVVPRSGIGKKIRKMVLNHNFVINLASQIISNL